MKGGSHARKSGTCKARIARIHGPETLTVQTWSRETNGIRILWYGINIPNSIRGKRIFAPRNFHLASTYPLIDPTIVAKSVPGITSFMLFQKLPERPCIHLAGVPA